jgi:hypothetical protein
LASVDWQLITSLDLAPSLPRTTVYNVLSHLWNWSFLFIIIICFATYYVQFSKGYRSCCALCLLCRDIADATMWRATIRVAYHEPCSGRRCTPTESTGGFNLSYGFLW